MHDSIALETRGIPTAAVATTEFRSAAAAQAAALGLPDYRIVEVEHPIQPLVTPELHSRADRVIEEIVARLTTP